MEPLGVRAPKCWLRRRKDNRLNMDAKNEISVRHRTILFFQKVHIYSGQLIKRVWNNVEGYYSKIFLLNFRSALNYFIVILMQNYMYFRSKHLVPVRIEENIYNSARHVHSQMFRSVE